MGARSRRKGVTGELEFAAALRSEGFHALRGAQHRGGPDSPDVLCPDLPELHFEVKRCERLSLYDAIKQASRDAGERIPVIAHRRNRHEWLAILPLTALLAILRESEFCRSEGETDNFVTLTGQPGHRQRGTLMESPEKD